LYTDTGKKELVFEKEKQYKKISATRSREGRKECKDLKEW
jgi:hypothetical protein